MGPLVLIELSSKTRHGDIEKEWNVESGVWSQRQVQGIAFYGAEVRKGLRVYWERSMGGLSG